MSRTDRKVTLRVLIGAAGLIAITVVAMIVGRARVSGDTPAERFESVQRIVADRPYGAASALSETAREDPSAKVRAAALTGLARVGGGKAKTFRAAAADADPAVRAAATDPLAAAAKPWSVDLLGALAAGDDDAEVRQAAVAALGRCPANDAVVALIALLDDAAAPDDARAAAAGALRRRCRINTPAPAPGAGLAWDEAVARYKADKVVRDAYTALGKQPPIYREELLPKHVHLDE